MNKGYQIIEPQLLTELFSTPNNSEVTLALLSWLAELLRTELEDRLGTATIEVIRVEYLGTYPALGIHYDRDDGTDLRPLVEMTVTSLLQRRTMSEFVSYIARSKIDWRKEIDKLIGSR